MGLIGHVLEVSQQRDDRVKFVGGIYVGNQMFKMLNMPLCSFFHWLESSRTPCVCDRVHFVLDWTATQRVVCGQLCSLC